MSVSTAYRTRSGQEILAAPSTALEAYADHAWRLYARTLARLLAEGESDTPALRMLVASRCAEVLQADAMTACVRLGLLGGEAVSDLRALVAVSWIRSATVEVWKLCEAEARTGWNR